jgi:hypothetical protein
LDFQRDEKVSYFFAAFFLVAFFFAFFLVAMLLHLLPEVVVDDLWSMHQRGI